MTYTVANSRKSLRYPSPPVRVQRTALMRRAASVRWTPQAGAQALAYACDADQIGYGGAAGAGKSELLLGLAGTRHRRSLIMRRVFPSLRGLIERSRQVYNADGASHARDSFNEQLHRWRLYDADGERVVEFGSCQYESDLKKWQGQPHDLLGIDEATEWPERFVRFLMAWNRTSDPGQQCRLVLTFNPPMDEEGMWVIAFFAPWLDERYPDPAESGEIRYVARIDNRDQFYRTRDDVPEPYRADAKTRTFIRGSLADNPILAASGYGATIEALPEPLRSLLKGNFAAGRTADPWQVIPTAWVRAAQQRWRARATPDVPLQSVGVDPARGGQDAFAIAGWYGNWVAPVETWPGVAVPDGPAGAALVLRAIEGVSDVVVGIDVIGIGSSVYDSVIAMDVPAIAVNNSETVAALRDRSGKFKFRNVRAASYWALREALDPEHGDDLALPDDPELLADLCAPRYRVTPAGIQLEDKDAIKARLGRSPNKGDAVVIGHWVLGQSTWLVWGA